MVNLKAIQMQADEARTYILSLYEHLLHRAPAPGELESWVEFARDGSAAETTYYAFVNSAEYKLKTRVSCLYHTGHYHSPVVDPSTVVDYVERERRSGWNEIAGIVVPLQEMEEFWLRFADVIARTPFQEAQSKGQRFYYDNNIFPHGDAITLRAMMADLRPRSVVEVGSGFSSACMLDCADEFQLDTKFTFIDPNPERLLQLLLPHDHLRVTVIEKPVQETDDRLYTVLGPGDILFINSTHVLKTGSDVHHELFHILPSLQRGVIVHFHDIQFPFEYPDQWIFDDNYSWNEIYALRAFLMYNTDFRIRFWGNCLAQRRTEIVRDVFPLFLKNPGGSLWIEKTP